MPNLRLALRMLFRTPALTAIAVLSLAIGIGANAAIFSLYNQMLLRPLPVRDPSGLVNLGGAGAEAGLPVVEPGRLIGDHLQLPDVPRPREGPDAVQRRRGPPDPRGERRVQGADHARDRDAGLGQLLRRPRTEARRPDA